MTHYITPEKLTFEQIEKILTKKYKLAFIRREQETDQ